jgi:hypothetical protein
MSFSDVPKQLQEVDILRASTEPKASEKASRHHLLRSCQDERRKRMISAIAGAIITKITGGESPV